MQYAKNVWQLDVANKDQAIDEAIARTEQFFQQVGVKTRLSDYHIHDAMQLVPSKIANEKNCR